MPQSRGYKEYSRKTRCSSRKNTSIDPDEGAEPEEGTKELLKKVKEQMRKFELLKKAAHFGVREGLGAMPLAEVLPLRTTIGQTTREGTQEEEEQGKIDESSLTQPSSIITI